VVRSSILVDLGKPYSRFLGSALRIALVGLADRLYTLPIAEPHVGGATAAASSAVRAPFFFLLVRQERKEGWAVKVTQAILEAMMGALGAATAGFGALTNKVCLIDNAFTPAPGMDTTSVTSYTTGSFAGKAAAGGYDVSINPQSGAVVLDAIPNELLRWEGDGDTEYPKTFYGHGLYKADGSVIFAAQRWDTPITVTAEGQVVQIADARITITFGSVN